MQNLDLMSIIKGEKMNSLHQKIILLETLINCIDLNRLGESLKYCADVKELRDKTVFF